MKNDKSDKKEEFKRKFATRLIKFTVEVLRYADTQKRNSTLQAILNQLIRSASSIGANITEAHGANSRRDYVNYFQIALKSAKETKYWIVVLDEYNTGVDKKLVWLKKEVTELIKIITSSILTLRGKR